jgi:hypothetical protein
MENYSSSLDESLLKAYKQTTYAVPSLKINIRIGEKCPLLDQLLQKLERRSWCFVTAWNPQSKLFSDEENKTRNHKLKEGLIQSGYIYYDGLGIGDDGQWPPEESILVIGINRLEALEIAKEWEQNAIVFGEIDEKASLILIK